ncbi:predicted Zn-dependent proteases and their inactivated homologs [Buchnera aphidicola (Nipponaphis monzeni)]|uniref:Predicted Zn-dependent proteases and their inactivated homologs n=1 Tax=Buchnera aphidicola (Nipponaphis monzeni) TaxID=2495405 RepID=A0A455T9T5_9GAMM|nr:metalloprotease PmbA [Buchnera aphidicola]BBI01089.1 predicted Zn-dependent proteases and their inactivated homologs [Buchnera aphidicola (Nipponaphis monzeni)]
MYHLETIQKEEIKLKELIQYVLNLANKKVDFIEVYIIKKKGINVTTRNTTLENVEYNNSGNMTITVYNAYKKGSVSFTKMNINNIKKMLNKAIDLSNHVSVDPYNQLPDKDMLALSAIKLNLFNFYLCNFKKIIKTNFLIEKCAFGFSKKITNTEGTNFCYSIDTIVLGNNLGLLQSYKTTIYSLSTGMIAGKSDNMQTAFYYTIARDINKLENPEYLGHQSAKRAIKKLYPKKIYSNKLPVIFISDISSCLFNNLAYAIDGYNIYTKSSFLIHSLKKQIFPNWLNIVEEPHLDQGIGSKPFDREGVFTQSRIIIEKGILNNWSLSTYTSKKLGLKTTGNLGGIYNWLVSYDLAYSLKALLQYMHKGILITELLGQGINFTNGDYSKGASGFFVDNGTIQHPVHEFTISSNLKDMFLNVVKISKDINKQKIIQCGSVLLSDMVISGI